MEYPDQAYRKMVKECLYNLISRWDAMEKFDTMHKALKYAVHIRGGFTIPEVCRVNDSYWFFEYYQNYKYGLWKDIGDKTIVEPIDKILAKELLNEIWHEYNKKDIQLRILF